MASLQGRAQIVPDRVVNGNSHGDLTFYLDGAHSPESLEVCARWFSLSIKEDRLASSHQLHHKSEPSHQLANLQLDERARKKSTQVNVQKTIFLSVIFGHLLCM